MRKVCRVTVEPVDAVLKKYRETLQVAEEECAASIRQRLWDLNRISGSAVVALPKADPGWQETMATLQAEFGQHLQRAINELIEG